MDPPSWIFWPLAAVPVFSSYLLSEIGGGLQLRWAVWSLEVPGLKQKGSSSQLRQLSKTSALRQDGSEHEYGFEPSSHGVTVGARQRAIKCRALCPCPTLSLHRVARTNPNLSPRPPSREGVHQTLQEMELLVPPQAGPPHEGRCGCGFSALAPPLKTNFWGQGTCLGHQTLQASPASWGAKCGAGEAIP